MWLFPVMVASVTPKPNLKDETKWYPYRKGRKLLQRNAQRSALLFLIVSGILKDGALWWLDCVNCTSISGSCHEKTFLQLPPK